AGVEALGVPPAELLDRRVHVHLEEASGRHERADRVPVAAVGRDERTEHDIAVLEEESRHLADPPDVLGAVLRAESEVAAEAVTHLVPLEQHRVDASLEEAALDLA